VPRLDRRISRCHCVVRRGTGPRVRIQLPRGPLRLHHSVTLPQPRRYAEPHSRATPWRRGRSSSWPSICSRSTARGRFRANLAQSDTHKRSRARWASLSALSRFSRPENLRVSHAGGYRAVSASLSPVQPFWNNTRRRVCPSGSVRDPSASLPWAPPRVQGLLRLPGGSQCASQTRSPLIGATSFHVIGSAGPVFRDARFSSDRSQRWSSWRRPLQ
jgi:hypothetical protein